MAVFEVHGVAFKILTAMNILPLGNIIFPSIGQVIGPPFEGIGHPREFGKIAAVIGKLYVCSSLHNRVKIIFHF